MSNPIVAVLRPFWQHQDLILSVVIKDFKVRYQGAALGFLWSLGNPLAPIALYDIVFTHVFRTNLHNYVLYLVIGVLHFNLFAGPVTQSCESLTGSAGLLQKIYFPRILMPTASFWFNIMLWSVTILVLVICYPFLDGEYHRVLLLYSLMLGIYLGSGGRALGAACRIPGYQASDGNRHDVSVLVDPHRLRSEHDAFGRSGGRRSQSLDAVLRSLPRHSLPGYSAGMESPALRHCMAVLSLAAGVSLFQQRARHAVEDL